MRPHPRTRKTIKWAGAATLILMLAAWVLSGWWHLQWSIRGSPSSPQFGLLSGRIYAALEPGTDPSPGLALYRTWRKGWYVAWLPEVRNTPSITIPLWLPTLALLLSTSAACLLENIPLRRAARGHCPACNYDLTGLPTPTPCPECGAVPASVTPAT